MKPQIYKWPVLVAMLFSLVFVVTNAMAQNLVNNPGFESQMTGWSTSAGSTVYTATTSGVLNGTYSAQGVEPGDSLGRLYQSFTGALEVGKMYKISGWIKTQDVTGGGVAIGLNYVAANGWSLAGHFVMEIAHPTGTTDWTYYESSWFELTDMPADAAALWFLFDFNGGGGTAFIDDVSLIRQPDSTVVKHPTNGHSYQRIDTNMTWQNAKSHCEGLVVHEGLVAHLATLSTAQESQFVFDNLLAGEPTWNWVWLGGTDETVEGAWEWVTGEPWLYEPWEPGEPNNACAGEDYLAMRPDGAAKCNDTNADASCGNSGAGLGFICEWVQLTPADDFVTTWKTDNPGTSNSTSITVPMIGGPYAVDWDNDGTFDEFGLSGSATHDYGAAGIVTIRIRGTYDSIRFYNGGDKEKILSLDQWGTNPWTSMYQAFAWAVNLQLPASDTPDFSAVTTMRIMFYQATSANPDTSGWDTSAVTNMGGMFRDATAANPDTSGWDTSAVTDMGGMFRDATSANPDTSGWNTSAVTDMFYMFGFAANANPDTSGWDTSAVTRMRDVFAFATAANPDTSNWDTSAVTDMGGMFLGATAANPDTSGWDTSAVTDMGSMFQSATAANPDTSNWDTSAVTRMSSMFYLATSADPDTSNWDTSLVAYMGNMFKGATLANPDTSSWDTGKVENMSLMFSGATSFDQDIGSWNVTSLTDATDMFTGVTLSNTNYEGLLTGWSSQALQTGVSFSGGNSTYCSATAVAARASMIASDSWVITDRGQECLIFKDGFEAPCNIDGIWAVEARDCIVEDCSGGDGRYQSWDGKIWCRALITQESEDWTIEVPPDVQIFDFWLDWGAWDLNDCGDGQSGISIAACGLNEPVFRDAEEKHLTCDVTGLSSLTIVREKGEDCEYIIIGDPYFH